MKNSTQPTSSEIRLWAFSENAVDPMGQDWDLVVSVPVNAVLILELASDVKCPNRNYFLRCLYLLVGEFVRVNLLDQVWRESILKIFALAEFAADTSVQKWLWRSRELVARPETFDREGWADLSDS